MIANRPFLTFDSRFSNGSFCGRREIAERQLWRAKRKVSSTPTNGYDGRNLAGASCALDGCHWPSEV